MNMKLWGGIVVTVLLIGAVMWAHNQPPVIDTSAPQEVVNDVVFYDQATGDALPATFKTTSVTFTSPTLGTMTLPQTISASGARYANADESIVFWNKGDSVFITQNGAIVFNGSIGVPPTKGKLPAGSTPPGDPKALIGTWVWQNSFHDDAKEIVPKKPGVFTITLTADGKVSGTTDCNGFGGEYTVGSDGVIKFGPFMSTQMYCEGSQESGFTTDMMAASRYVIDPPGQLTLLFGEGPSVIYFTKK